MRAVYDGYLEWAGWPPGRARLSDCLLVDKADERDKAEIAAWEQRKRERS